MDPNTILYLEFMVCQNPGLSDRLYSFLKRIKNFFSEKQHRLKYPISWVEEVPLELDLSFLLICWHTWITIDVAQNSGLEYIMQEHWYYESYIETFNNC
jgi:hypothetical protein